MTHVGYLLGVGHIIEQREYFVILPNIPQNIQKIYKITTYTSEYTTYLGT